MNWKFWKTGETELPKDGRGTPEKIDGWRLSIEGGSGRLSYYYDNIDFRTLWKIYNWYLTKSSDKYNIQINTGYRILHRNGVTGMELVRTKLIKSDWIKENDDEAKTDS